MKYFMYCRKSSEEDTKQMQSLGTQERILTEYAVRNDLDIVEVIKESRSAKDDNNRPLFNQMLARIKAGEANAILVVHPDRLARNMIELGEITKLRKLEYLKEICTPSATYKTTADIFQLEMMGVFAAQYSRDLSDKVNAGMKSKVMRGEYPSQAPIGYLNTKAGLIPDPQRAHYIQEAFKKYSSGTLSLQNLTKYLHAQGFRTKAGKKVYKSVIERILKNKTYYGVLDHHGTLYPANHQPLITKQQFDVVQEVLTGRNRSKKQKHDFLYRDYLYCHVCGCKMTATIKKGKYRYYYCTNGKGKCSQHQVYQREKQIFQALQPVFSDISLDEELASFSLEIYAQELKKKDRFTKKAGDQIAHQLEANKLKLQKLEDLYLEDGISLLSYKEKRLQLQNDRVELQTQLQQQKSAQPESTLELLQKFKKYACTIEKMFEDGDSEVKSDLLKSVLWNCKLQDGKVISTRYKLPFALLKDAPKTAEFSEWRRWRDSNPRNR